MYILEALLDRSMFFYIHVDGDDADVETALRDFNLT